MALCLVLSFSNYSNSQTLESTSNLLNLGGGLPWENTVTGAAGGTSGGTTPAYNPSTGNIIFGNVQNTVSQSIAINSALANAGTGIQLFGYKYSWDINNDLSNGGGNRGTLTGNVSLTGTGGNILEQYSYDYSQTNTGNAFQKFSGTQLFTNQYQLSAVDKLTVSFTGKDQNFWAGYYGPRVHVNDVSLLYKTDPCATNPAYSSTCAGFSNVLNTNNLVDSTKGGASLNQAFAINTALENAGIGAMVHGFNYGFNYRIGQSFSGCTATNQDGSCSWYMNIPAYVNANVSLTNNSSKPQAIFSQNYSFTGDGTSGSVSEKFLLPTSLNQSMLGTGRITGSASGTGSSIEGAWATMIYTADPCASNPLYSPDCKGYASAISKQISASMPASTSSLDSSDSPLDLSSPPPPPGSQPPPGSTPPPSNSPTSDPNNMQSQPPQQQAGPALASAPSSSAPVTSAAPTANNPQPKPGEVQTAGSSGPSALAMSVVASVQSRVGATERATVQQANEAAATATAQAVELAETVAGAAQANSIASSTSTSSSSNSSSTGAMSSTQTASVGSSLQSVSQSTAISMNVLKPYTPPSDTTVTDNNGSSTSIIGLDAPRGNATSSVQATVVQPQQTEIQPLQTIQPIQQPVTMYQAPSQIIQSNVNYSLTESSTFTFDTGRKIEAPVFTEVEIPKTDSFKMGTRSTLNDYMNEQPFMSLMGIEPTQDSTVRRNVQPNEVAGGVDIASMATQPKGYDAYAQMTLKDTSFYKVEDIYKGQRNVDNVRLLRGLTSGSDRLHQNMVDQQYKGN